MRLPATSDRVRPAPDPPDLILEQLRLGELDEPRAAALRRRLDDDPAIASRLSDLARSDEAIRHAHPAAGMARRMVEAAGPTSLASRLATLTVPAAAVAAVVASLWVGLPARAPSAAPRDGWSPTGARVKGAAAVLEVFRRTPAGSERLADGAATRAGDTLRLGYRLARPAFGVIVSVDGRGVVTRHHPVDGARAVALTAGEMVLLDRAFELDDAPRFEQFHLVTGATPFEITPVVEAVAAGTVGRLPATLADAIVSVAKEPRP